MFVLLLINLVFLKETPRQIGEPELASHSDSLFGEQGNDPVPAGVWALGPAPSFPTPGILVRLHAHPGLTLLREAFNTWIPHIF